jgi:hypothetical protein
MLVFDPFVVPAVRVPVERLDLRIDLTDEIDR